MIFTILLTRQLRPKGDAVLFVYEPSNEYLLNKGIIFSYTSEKVEVIKYTSLRADAG
jgi:hypothetical protein